MSLNQHNTTLLKPNICRPYHYNLLYQNCFVYIYRVCQKNPLCFEEIYLFLIFGSVLTLLVGQHEGHPACKKTKWWGAGVVICLESGADLHMAQLMPLPLTFSCFSKIQICFTFQNYLVCVKHFFNLSHRIVSTNVISMLF